MTKVCRTCGFADCPGATTGNCPRWPARDTSDLDRLTRPDLTDLHERLYREQQIYFHAMFGHDYQPVIEVGGPTWDCLAAKMNEVRDLMAEVYAEIVRRREEAKADA